jgi:hypothetical protein
LYEREVQNNPWYWLVAVLLLYPVFVEWDIETSGQAFGIVSYQVSYYDTVHIMKTTFFFEVMARHLP